MRLRDLFTSAAEVADLRDRVVTVTAERDAARQVCMSLDADRTRLATQVAWARLVVRGLREQNEALRRDMSSLLDRQVTE